jgi:formylglycine-generating enzyme required for sulfatase activity/ABC-type phosphate transport system substrate-binding protein
VLKEILLLAPLIAVATAGAQPLRLGTSEALDPAVKAWGEAWAAARPGAQFTLGAGAGATSAEGVTLLLEGKLEAVFTGRPLRPAEVKAYADRFGGPPLLFAVATPRPYGKQNRSALGVLVHPDNPLRKLTLAQLDAIFSASRRRGGKSPTTWGQLGLTGKWADAPIRACAPEADSGTAQYFREAVLWGGDFAPAVKQLARLSDSVVRAVAADPFALGVTSLNFADDTVRALAIAAAAGAPAFAPTDENCGSLAYPLTRQAYLCVNPPTAAGHAAALIDFVRFVLGPGGQAVAAAQGFVPLAAAQIAEAHARFAAAPPAAGGGFRLHDLALELKWIPPGEFDLGSPDNEGSRGVDEGPLTRVKLTRGYWLGQTEVTQAQWQAIMGTPRGRFRGPGLPVEQVSWHEAVEFCRRLDSTECAAGRVPAGYAYALPTESQWEFAAEAGKPEGVPADVDDQAWHDLNSGGTTHPVAQKRPNRWGLYDMLGNVWEWCADWYAPYPGGNAVDYAGPAEGESGARANRGASWWAGPRGQRSANRYRDMPQNGNDDLGFRLALVPAR